MKTNRQALDEEVDALKRMAHSPVRNYAIPGLTSYLIGQPGPQGCVRLFVCERDHEEPIVPHSHRFDFTCRVLRGRVLNVLWERADPRNVDGSDLYQVSKLVYADGPGKYQSVDALDKKRFTRKTEDHLPGDVYHMKADQIHSIFFRRGTVVQFLEGPTVRNESLILQPVVNGEVIPTFKVEPWMFQRGLG